MNNKLVWFSLNKIKIVMIQMLPKVGKNGPMLTLDNVSSVEILQDKER
jgi:hypothetical protein